MRVFMLVAMLAWGFPALSVETATIVEGARAKMRSGKYDTYRVVKALEPGTVVEILNQEKSYVQVKTNEGEIGWLPLRAVKIAVAPPPVEPAVIPVAQQMEIAPASAVVAQNVKAQQVSSLWLLIGVGSAGLVSGVLLGVGGMLAYYRKKLNGLRI